MDNLIPILLTTAVICGALGAAISPAGTKGLGFVLGFLLGPIGVIVAAVLSSRGSSSSAPAGYRPAGGPRTDAHSYTPLAATPDHLTIKRDGQIIGTWPLADALDYLNRRSASAD